MKKILVFLKKCIDKFFAVWYNIKVLLKGDAKKVDGKRKSEKNLKKF